MDDWLFEARISPEALGLPLENLTMCIGLTANTIILVVLKVPQTLLFRFYFGSFPQKSVKESNVMRADPDHISSGSQVVSFEILMNSSMATETLFKQMRQQGQKHHFHPRKT